MDGPFYMDAVITPHRSLSQRGFIVLISVLTTINALSAIVFLRMGAAPVPAFLGLDVFALTLALLINRRGGLNRERVQVTASEIHVWRETPKGAETLWRSPTAFTRVALVGADEDDPDLQLRLSGRGVAVARALSRAERCDFAAALERAVRKARAGDANL